MSISAHHKHFLLYLNNYLGVALIAGSVVHIGTLQNGFTRYIILAVVGLLLMMIGTIIEAHEKGQKVDLRYLSVITLLSFATGFLSGGIQHYLDNPIYAGFLLSVGLFVAYLTYFMKQNLRVSSKNIIIVFFISLTLLILSITVVKDIAMQLHTTFEGDHMEPHAH